MRVAAANWLVRRVASIEEFESHFRDIASAASNQEANLLVLPENFALELLCLHPGYAEADVVPLLLEYADRIDALIVTVADELNLSIVGGSHFRRGASGTENASLIRIGGKTSLQSKCVLTQYEISPWGLAPGTELNRTPDPRVGALICYDSEFPESARAHAEAGVLLLCVPAYTESEAGFHRVRNCCLARATENQIFVAHASLVGGLGQEPVFGAVGTSAILSPAIEPFPDDGVLVETDLGIEALAIADVDFDELLAAREQGDVRNWNDRHRCSWQVTG